MIGVVGTVTRRLSALGLAGVMSLVTGTCGPGVDGLGGPTDPNPQTRSMVGAPWTTDSLANLVVGGPKQQGIQFHFVAKQSSPIAGLRLFWATNFDGREGYSSGDGGVIRLQLLDVASKKIMSSQVYRPSLSEANNRSKTFEEVSWATPTLTAGHAYRIDFTNISPDPVGNYISINTLYCECRDDGPDPDDDGWRSSMVVGKTTYSLSPLTTASGSKWYRPIMALRYANAAFQGNGYMEVWVSQPRVMGGGARVREHFGSVAAATRFNTVQLRAQVAQSGSFEALVVVNGQTVSAGRIETTAMSDPQWLTWKLDRPVNVDAGAVMSIEFGSPDGSANVVALRDGQTFGFGPSTVVADGYAQADLGSGWQGWAGFNADGDSRLKDGDLAFLASWRSS
jgi:hypothetical protein